MSTIVEIIFKTIKQGNGEKEAIAATKGVSGGISSLTKDLLANVTPWAMVGGAALKAAEYMRAAEKAANESNLVMAKQEAILRATGYAANLASSELQDMAGELSRLTGIDDEAIQSAQSLMLTFRNIGREEFPRAMQAAADLQTTFGGLQESTMQLGKAANDFTGYTALQRAGVTFSEEQKQQIQNFKETNDLAAYQNLLFSEIEKQVGGTAAAIEAASDGSNRLKVSSDNLQEALGQGLIPISRVWNNTLANIYDEILRHVDAQNRYAEAARKTIERENEKTVVYKSAGRGRSEYTDAIKAAIAEEIRATEYGQAWEKTLRAQGVQFEGNTSKIKDHTDAIEIDAEAMTKANEATLKGVEQWQGMEESFTNRLDGLYSRRKDLEADYAKYKAQGYWETSEQIQGVLEKMAEVDTAIQNEKEQYDIKTKAVVLGYLEQKMVADGILDDKETEWLLKKGVEWGVYKQSAIDAYKTALAEANNFYATVSGFKDKTLTITTVYAEAGPRTQAPPLNKRASGGLAFGRTLVGERGPEIVDLPPGSFVRNTSTTQSILQTTRTDEILQRLASRPQPTAAEIGRAVAQAISQMG